jgi:hypothetical protein
MHRKEAMGSQALARATHMLVRGLFVAEVQAQVGVHAVAEVLHVPHNPQQSLCPVDRVILPVWPCAAAELH